MLCTYSRVKADKEESATGKVPLKAVAFSSLDKASTHTKRQASMHKIHMDALTAVPALPKMRLKEGLYHRIQEQLCTQSRSHSLTQSVTTIYITVE